MKIAICDDNKLFLQELKEQIKEISATHEVECFAFREDFLALIAEGQSFDAVFLDIDWKDNTTGIDMAEKLYQLAPGMSVIYVTGYTDRFVQQIFLNRSNLCGFLSKPVNRDLLAANLHKVTERNNEVKEEILFLRVGGAVESVLMNEILYIESHGHTITVHTAARAVSAYEKLSDLAERLPENFLQTHKSYYINMRQIQRFQSNDILLKNGISVPVSRSRYSKAKESYFYFMGREF